MSVKNLMHNEIKDLLAYLSGLNSCQTTLLETLEYILDKEEPTRFYSDKWQNIKKHYKQLSDLKTNIEKIINDTEMLYDEIKLAERIKTDKRYNWYKKSN